MRLIRIKALSLFRKVGRIVLSRLDKYRNKVDKVELHKSISHPDYMEKEDVENREENEKRD